MEETGIEGIVTTTAQRARRNASAPRAAGIAGIVFAALFTVSVILLRYQPPEGASAETIADWDQA